MMGTGGAGGVTNTTVTLDVSATFQTMEGFGGAVAFYTNWLTGHPNRSEIADVIFRDLGLDILRIANWSENAAPAAFDDSVAVVNLARASMAPGPRILMSSWSPPATLKDTGDTKNGGTLARQADGAFAYAGFGQWWARALSAYAARGVRPDYISIQNEPNFTATWETCRFGPSETATRAGYGQALAAVHAEIQAMSPRPQLIGPETAGIVGTSVQGYLGGAGFDISQVDGIAHHLYSGGDGAAPDSFVGGMAGVAAAADAAGKPIFMTEYSDVDADMVAVAWLIHNAITVGGAAAYVYWDLVWAPPMDAAATSALVTLENPFSPGTWTATKGYIVRDAYHAVRHYSRWVDSDWRRVGATSTSVALKISAFLAPDGAHATLVMVNTDVSEHAVMLATGDFAYVTSAVYRSSGADERTADLGPLGADAIVTLPARSIATVTLTR